MTTFLKRLLVFVGLSGCGAIHPQPVPTTGGVGDVPDYLRMLHSSRAPDAFLIIEVEGTGDFIQFAAAPDAIQLDLPMVTDRQRQFESPFRTIVSDLKLELRETRGSDGSRFLDVILPFPSDRSGQIVQEVVSRLYQVDEETTLTFVCSSCS